MKAREIAVRGFINEKFGTTFGKGLFHRAIYNGSVEIRDPYTKYLIDLFEFNRWEHSAKTDEQITWTKRLHEAGVNSDSDAAVSWVQHYDPITKAKHPVDGICVYLPNSQELHLSINDPVNNIVDHWTLDVKACTKTGVGKPVFIAANVDL